MEIVNIWIEEFKNSNKSISEEIEDVKGTISNERLWVKGSETPEQIQMHEENIAELEEFLDWLESEASNTIVR